MKTTIKQGKKELDLTFISKIIADQIKNEREETKRKWRQQMTTY